MNNRTQTQSGFTPTPNFAQSMTQRFKYFINSKVSRLILNIKRREQSSQRKNWCRGFTLIEMIVSLGLFSVVITIAVGALLMMVSANQRLQGEQSVMTNLSFALDSMTREIRTGTDYYCDWSVNKSGVFGDNTDVDDEHGDGNQDCSNGNPSPSTNYFIGMSFKEGGESITSNAPGTPERVLYYFDKSQGKIIRKIGTNEAPLTSSGIYIKNFDVFVSGSDPLTSGDTEKDQASVTLFIEAAETADPNQKSYFLQTTISQRTLDI